MEEPSKDQRGPGTYIAGVKGKYSSDDCLTKVIVVSMKDHGNGGKNTDVSWKISNNRKSSAEMSNNNSYFHKEYNN